jgi:hypothetical protein
MNELRQNYVRWFQDVVRTMYSQGDSGFAILMISIPLLERYLRQKSGTYESLRLESPFYAELSRVFPSLSSELHAKEFWHVFRNGLLHQATLSRATARGVQMPAGVLSADAPAVGLDQAGTYLVNPRKFADRVFEVIDGDFAVFEATGSANHPLPQIFVFPSDSGLSLSNGTGNAVLSFTPPATGSS